MIKAMNIDITKYVPEGAKVTSVIYSGNDGDLSLGITGITLSYDEPEDDVFVHFNKLEENKMTPEPKLVWSTVKPTFEEVKGKKLRAIKVDKDGDADIYGFDILNHLYYDKMFDDEFICYADLTAPVSPLPLWGVEPVLHEPHYDERYEDRVIYPPFPFWVITYDYADGISIQSKAENRDLAILAWNRIAEALNEVEK